MNMNNHIYYMFNKPSGCVTARKDPRHKTVLDYFDNKEKENLLPAGRLDLDTEGLLILTDNGKFIHELMHPDKKKSKTYEFWAIGTLNDDNIADLESGITFENGRSTSPCQIEVIKKGLYSFYKNEIPQFTIKKKKISIHNDMNVFYGQIKIYEGQKHQVKRMLKAGGCYIIYLKRTSISSLELDKNLRPGEYRFLSPLELELLTKKDIT